MTRARLAEREEQNTQPKLSANSGRIPACPQCGKPTVLRTAKTGPNAGKQFWGRTSYPGCKGVVKV